MDFKAPQDLPRTKYHGSGRHSIRKCLQDLANFHRSRAWQIVPFLTLDICADNNEKVTYTSLSLKYGPFFLYHYKPFGKWKRIPFIWKPCCNIFKCFRRRHVVLNTIPRISTVAPCFHNYSLVSRMNSLEEKACNCSVNNTVRMQELILWITGACIIGIYQIGLCRWSELVKQSNKIKRSPKFASWGLFY